MKKNVKKANIVFIKDGSDARNNRVYLLKVEELYSVQVPHLNINESFETLKEAEKAYLTAIENSNNSHA